MPNRKFSAEHRRIRALFAKLMRTPYRKFPECHGRLEAPTAKGIYVIHSPKGKIMHVGATPRAKRGIRQRLFDHLQGRSAFTKRCFRHRGYKLRDGYKFRYLVVENARDRALLEPYAIGCLCPAFIGYGDAGSHLTKRR
jgi:hypothetical protein